MEREASGVENIDHSASTFTHTITHRRNRTSESARPTVDQGYFTIDVGFLSGPLDSFRKELAENTGVYTAGVAATAGALSVLTVGYTTWMVRGGYLLSSLLSSLPAWRTLDPLPVLSSYREPQDKRRREDENENETLQDIIEQFRAS